MEKPWLLWKQICCYRQEKMMKKKISWITPDYYIDVDLPIVDRLSQIFTIKWMIVISRNASIIDNKNLWSID